MIDAVGMGESATVSDEVPAGRATPASAPPWPWTLACAVVILALGAAAVILPLALDRPLAQSAGWILLIGGAIEFVLGTTCLRSPLGKAALLCGGLSALAGLAFIAGGLPELFTLTNLVMVWLFARGFVLLVQGLVARREVRSIGHWLIVRGLTDAALAATLLLSLPVIALMIVTFGETREAVTTFSGLLSISFLVTGVALAATALAERRFRIEGPC